MPKKRTILVGCICNEAAQLNNDGSLPSKVFGAKVPRVSVHEGTGISIQDNGTSPSSHIGRRRSQYVKEKP